MSKFSTPEYIIGAGLTGLIAAHAWPTAKVLEKAGEPRAIHKALLRFRTDAVSRLTGVEFRKVRVRKGIYSDGRSVTPDIRLANQYSTKVLEGRIENDRSIWNLDAVDRFIAPETLYEMLLEAVRPRITFNFDVTASPRTLADWPATRNKSILSTIPLPSMLTATGLMAEGVAPKFFQAPIKVMRFRVPDADVFQTVYFPDPELNVYRASMTGDLLIVECMASPTAGDPDDIYAVADAFGLRSTLQSLGGQEQQFGKIAPIPDAERRQLLFQLTQRFNIYSLGRFAIWKNILLDDVVQDIDVIKRLMRSGAAYDHHRASV